MDVHALDIDHHVAPPASHLAALPHSGWRLWRTVVVRGAGFAAAEMDVWAPGQAARAADRVLATTAAAAMHVERALAQIADEIRSSLPERRRELRAIRDHIRQGTEVPANAGAIAGAAAAAVLEMNASQTAFREAFEAEVGFVSDRLTALAVEPRFREAMLWQNADATRWVTHSLRAGARPSRKRHAIRHLALRAQRCFMKNDAIGFFGPIGWAHIDDAVQNLDVSPGPGLTSHREVFFEGWCIDAVARHLSAEPMMRPWIAPRLKAGVWVDAARAHVPLKRALPLTAAEVEVLALCDGERTASTIARQVLPSTPAQQREAETFAILSRLASADVISWRLDVAPQLYPERELVQQLERVGDRALRERSLGALRQLVEARDRVRRSAGNVVALEHALEQLDTCFTTLTAEPASRRRGQMYAGRGLVYEDCRRDCDVRIGSSLLERIGTPLGIVLDAARWAAGTVADVLRERLRVLHRELCKGGDPEVDCHLFVAYVVATLWSEPGHAPLFEGACRRFQQLWDVVLAEPRHITSARAVFVAEEVRARATAAFPARDPGWSFGRYLSPDLMIAAPGLAAVQRGEYHAVLGEVHSGNTVGVSSCVSQHPDAQTLFAALASDTHGETVILPQLPKHAWLARRNLALVQPHFWRYQFGDDRPALPPCRALPAASLVVVDDGQSVVVRAKDGREFDALDLFGFPLLDEVNRVIAEFRPRVAHAPRITIGDLTIARERWITAARDPPFRDESDPVAQFLAVRKWAHDQGMPRRVFVKSPAERKPCYLDFDSTIYVEIFVSMLRQLDAGALVQITEMLPDVSDLWLHDGTGRHYTSELRCVARYAH